MTFRSWVTLALLVACRTESPALTREAAPEPPEAAAVRDAGAAPIEDAAVDAGAPEGMIFVPRGTFTMGADRGGEEDEHPAHAVTLDGFWLDRTPVTNAEYAKCVEAHACRPPGARDARFERPAQPVDKVSWDDAKAYCDWAGKRLPREAEYERAMRDDDRRKYAWGNDPPTFDRAAFGRSLDAGAPDDVGAHPSGRGPFGHDDLVGEVWEWCADEYDPIAYRRKDADRGIPGTCAQIMATEDELRARGEEGFTGSNPIPRGCDHVLRGGGFNYDGLGLRATNRVHHPGHYRMLMAGFRCAK